jgi:hypothetical protein
MSHLNRNTNFEILRFLSNNVLRGNSFLMSFEPHMASRRFSIIVSHHNPILLLVGNASMKWLLRSQTGIVNIIMKERWDNYQ